MEGALARVGRLVRFCNDRASGTSQPVHRPRDATDGGAARSRHQQRPCGDVHVLALARNTRARACTGDPLRSGSSSDGSGTEDDLDPWYEAYASYFRKHFKRKVDVILDLTRFHLNPRIARRFGEVRARVLREFTERSYRVNADAVVKTAICTSHVLQGAPRTNFPRSMPPSGSSRPTACRKADVAFLVANRRASRTSEFPSPAPVPIPI